MAPTRLPRPLVELAISTPIGLIRLGATARGLARVAFANEPAAPADDGSPVAARAVLEQAVEELNEYFAHERTVLRIPLDVTAVPPFHRTVLSALREIPYGTTASYGQLAATIGRAGASRAVGRACATNPVPIVIPCHRVVHADESLGGYRGGINAKQWLLQHEGATHSLATPPRRLWGPR
jgi:methylated-DNA-[protein]-cysteine S-methyltransferase